MNVVLHTYPFPHISANFIRGHFQAGPGMGDIITIYVREDPHHQSWAAKIHINPKSRVFIIVQDHPVQRSALKLFLTRLAHLNVSLLVDLDQA